MAKSILDQCQIMEFKEFGDERGNLIVLEGNIDIPFEP
ncbi:MAG: WxcM-like domain-containing protein [Streptococcus gallolyticus]|nr:WxcM-like domain-containing protein [Streptococcus gallolyticus]